ncbi:LysR substrate-binding domain-containing protein [Diaphorobacter caeni]|uniref:LysR substrate-binding domain-containing protein n=1 Tax=Diaphorobacter caeni TaxID=2784387 RepID=UPI00188F912A|nr:LysR substrate-binding domain-containing protein [Diaphorobacter caeni]MBF5007647.1 LysR family transcriptional regulator [Diaphorobacter caeni]
MARQLGFRHIETIHAIVLTGSVTGAATRLHVTQPAISNVLRDAEDRLGLALFERRGGRLIPTAHAEALFAEIERSFVGLESINSFAARLNNDQHRALSVACTPAFGASVLPRVTAEYSKRAQKTLFYVHSRVAHHVAAQVSSGKCDLGFGLEVPPVPGVECEVIGELPIMCYLPRGHKLASKKWILPEHLLNEPMISLSSVEGVDVLAKAAFQGCERMPESVIECPAAILACSMVAAGLGFVLFDALPSLICDPARLVVRPFRSPSRLRYCAYRLKSKNVNPEIEQLIGLARAELASVSGSD